MSDSSPVVKRHSRALRILSCLQSGPSFNARELARRMNVSRRTIYRDLNLIRAAGIDVFFDETHDSYRIRSHRDLAPLKLEPEDLTRLVITSQLSPFASLSEDFEVSVRESMSRLLGPYPEEIRDPIQRIINCCRIRPSRSDKRLSDMLQRMMVAIGRGVQVQLVVDSQISMDVVRFSPHMIEMDGTQWRVIGRTSKNRTRQVFYLEDIKNVELTNLPYSIPRNNRTRVYETAS